MGDSTIEWTDKTWNPLVGCEYASEGCRGCYAARDAFGRLSGTATYAGLAHRRTPDELPRFTGEIRLLPERLDEPLRWRKPARVFVNSMSDLFHPDVPTDYIAKVFAVMAVAREHTFQVLTKRPHRMAALTNDIEFEIRVYDAIAGFTADGTIRRDRAYHGPYERTKFPLRNVWLGTSVESQEWADRRVPKLLEVKAAIRFLSVEPLLGPVDLRSEWLYACGDRQHRHYGPCSVYDNGRARVDWVIVGGESGPRSRPMHPQWVREIREACVAAEVPFLFKQWGEWCPISQLTALPLDPQRFVDLDGCGMVRLGKKAAGRELDGRTWDEYPDDSAGL